MFVELTGIKIVLSNAEIHAAVGSPIISLLLLSLLCLLLVHSVHLPFISLSLAVEREFYGAKSRTKVLLI